MYLPPTLTRLIELFSKLPSIGPRTAQRLAFHILMAPQEQAEQLSRAIIEARGRVRFCRTCNNITEDEICGICRDERRDRSIICVVEEPQDLLAIERSGGFKGVYHVLLGAISPLEGIGPDDLKMDGLLARLNGEEIKEVLIATNPNTEGETTSLYITKFLKPRGIRLTRLARGIPVGGDLESTDGATLTTAFEGRREIIIN
ncbi:TPA: recombination protein RecR [bacterium]|nr:recombination protein RecR [bacterium]